ncbi:MAG: glucose-6-phosphate isomerase [Desulfonatronovibrionaceae bacterium]
MNLHLTWNHAYLGRVRSEAAFGREEKEKFLSQAKEGKLPFLTLEHIPELEKDLAFSSDFLAGFKHMLLLGIGGSALGARVLQKAFAPGQDRPGHTGPWLWIADNVCADTLEGYMHGLDPAKTVVVVVSKSGGTIETISQYFLIRDWMERELGEKWPKHFILVTDPDKGFLRQECRTYGIRSLPVPQEMGGRYSVLSAVGLLPAQFLGLDWKEIVAGAREAAEGILSQGPELDNGSASGFAGLALWAVDLIRAGYSQLIFFNYIPEWAALGDWFAQLWAESLGKNGLGSTPLPAVGVTDQHSLQQLFLDGPADKGCMFISAGNMNPGPAFSSGLPRKWGHLHGRRFGDLLQAEALGTQMALTERQVPLIHLRAESPDLRVAGRLLVGLEGMTYLTGLLLGINPLDQPAVELGKRLANAELGAEGFEAEKERLQESKAAKKVKEVV